MKVWGNNYHELFIYNITYYYYGYYGSSYSRSLYLKSNLEISFSLPKIVHGIEMKLSKIWGKNMLKFSKLSVEKWRFLTDLEMSLLARKSVFYRPKLIGKEVLHRIEIFISWNAKI